MQTREARDRHALAAALPTSWPLTCGVLFAAPVRPALREPTWNVQLSDTGDVVEQLSEGREQVPVMCHRAHEYSFGLCVATLNMRPAA